MRVGQGSRSLAASSDNFGKPWYLIYTDHGRVSGFYFALKYVD